MSGIALGAAAVAAAGSVAGGIMASKGSKSASNTLSNAPVSYYNPNSDPVLSGISLEALLGLGQGSSGVGLSADPMAQVLSIAGQSGSFNSNEIGAIQAWLPTIYQYGVWPASGGQSASDVTRGKAAVQRALSLAGYSSIEEFQKAGQKYSQEQAAYESAVGPVRQQVLEGRLASYTNIAQLAKDFPNATLADINKLQADYEGQINRQISQQVRDSQSEILQQANVARGNPAATLGRLREQELLQRQAAPTNSLERALQMLQGRQTLGQNAINAYQSILEPGQNLALNVAALRTSANQNAVNAANQNSQFTATGQANAQQASANSLANGIATGTNALATAGSSYANQMALMKYLQGLGGPGTSDPNLAKIATQSYDF